MTKQSVLGLKQEILESLSAESQSRIGTEAQGLVSPNVERRLAVGYSQLSKKDFWLELRVQRGKGTAYRKAEEIKEKACGEANIEIIPRIEIPSKSAVHQLTRKKKQLTKRIRPLHMGLSVGHLDGGVGTLGAFIDTPKGEAVLSNNHVLAMMGRAELDDPIFQPGKEDKPRLYSSDRIARLATFSEISREDPNEVDSAIALLLNGVEHDSNKIPEGLDFPMEGKMIRDIDGFDLLEKHKVVCKIGRTTGFTTGLISAVALDRVPVWTPIGNVLFNNVIEISWESSRKPFSKPGDSGSLVFTKKELAAVGLHFAGGVKQINRREVGISYSCNLATVLADYSASLLE
ncbi:MAG: hypothetical protein ACE5IW_12680 [bacterium]